MSARFDRMWVMVSPTTDMVPLLFLSYAMGDPDPETKDHLLSRAQFRWQGCVVHVLVGVRAGWRRCCCGCRNARLQPSLQRACLVGQPCKGCPCGAQQRLGKTHKKHAHKDLMFATLSRLGVLTQLVRSQGGCACRWMPGQVVRDRPRHPEPDMK